MPGLSHGPAFGSTDGVQCFPVGHTGTIVCDLASSRHVHREGCAVQGLFWGSMCQHQQHPEAPASSQHTPLGSPGLYIQTLLPGSPAASDGRLSLGDRILEVNGSSLMGVSYMRCVPHLACNRGLAGTGGRLCKPVLHPGEGDGERQRVGPAAGSSAHLHLFP